jgi:hypothetical protein
MPRCGRVPADAKASGSREAWRHLALVRSLLAQPRGAGRSERLCLRELTAGFVEVRMWGIGTDEAYADAIASGDQVLI